jgi:[protein-PII] uridylyltransferase
VQDAEGGSYGDEQRIARLRDTIVKALSGQIVLGAALAKRPPRRRTTAFQIRPQVNFDNEASATATIIEVEGVDRPGLLYDVSRAIFESGLSISSAIVATYGERAVDVFYVRDGFGHKIVHGDRQEDVRTRIVKAMTGEAA